MKDEACPKVAHSRGAENRTQEASAPSQFSAQAIPMPSGPQTGATVFSREQNEGTGSGVEE